MRKIAFQSKDGLLVTGDDYSIENPRGFILLCHRSHSNRAEYRETAPKLNTLGYSCLAIDQRSGMKVFGTSNETKDYAYTCHGNKPIILLGSSYSATLALLVAFCTDKVKAVIAFSPGEYLKGINVANEIALLEKHVYVTSAKSEIEQAFEVVRYLRLLTQYKPEEAGAHGAKILWESVEGYEKHWAELTKFLDKRG